MSKTSLLCVGLAMILLGVAAAPVAAVTVYTDRAAWENALNGQYLLEDFSDSVLNDGLGFTSSESGHINPAEECYQDVLASLSHNEPMTTWRLTPVVTAYGGNWTLGGPGGSGNSLLVYIADADTYVGSISNSYNGGFWGFIADEPFNAVKLIGGTGNHQQNYRLDDMVYSLPACINGDINCDDQVGLLDLDILGENWKLAPALWEQGDLSGNGQVDLLDLDILGATWGNVVAPEPATLGLFMLSAALAARRRTGNGG